MPYKQHDYSPNGNRYWANADRFDMENNIEAPKLPAFKDGEMKKLALGFREIDGKVEITMASHGMNDDINEMVTFLAFALDKILDS